jgi:hypothetical protein
MKFAGQHGSNIFNVRIFFALLSLLLFFSFSQAHAANYPCSQGKGGVSHCMGALFVCNDGSISGSKKICSETGDPKVMPLIALQRGASIDDCSCRSDRICTGPRGGQYCISDSGNKSYVRK